MAEERDLLRYREAAALLGVAESTVIRWTRPGKNGEPPVLRARKLGARIVRIARSDVDAILAAATTPGEVTPYERAAIKAGVTPSEADAIIARARKAAAMHPTDTGPGWVDADGNPARVVLCPDCGQMEWWTEAECTDHGQCRASNAPCWCEVRP